MVATMDALTGRIVSLTLGSDSITNCKSFKWRTVHNVAPRLLPSSKIPTGWFQGHKWVEGEFSLMSICSAIATHAPPATDAVIISPMSLASQTTAGTAVTYAFTGFIIVTIDKELDGVEPLYVHHFLAYSVTETKS